MSSYYEPQGWQAPSATPRQASWEQPVPPSRSGSSSVSQRDDSPAFSSQFDEVDRAIDNLVKSGKLWNAPRRDSMPMMMGRPYPEYDPRMGGPQRHHSVSEFENNNTNNRAHPSGNAQGFYASQRYQGRTNEVDQMMQAKRRMAAQRERELRNYHQEQQYNRSLLAEMSASKSDRSLSPAAMGEENHRGLLHRQHRALYGNESPAFFNTGPLSDDNSRPDSQAATPSSAGVRGSSPRAVDAFGLTQTPVAESTSSLQSPSRANSTSSPSSAINAGFPDQPGTATSSPGGADSPSSRQAPSKPGTGPIGSVGVGPIGSRPVAGQPTASPSNPALNKRSTTPLPSPLGFGFTPGEAAASHAAATSATSNPAVAAPAASGPKDPSAGGVGLGWSNGSGVWGSKSGLGVQASVWG
ncbi:hypothetical protein N7509_011141 [Penicillium cosmopolitanum]|uniref:Uncharacterized protein n=1 Tax=Penicillium cosmopolitanum TaxID=1131564 RepID=A0A9W9VT08_9EURO|nr:uncharacterized protein N7509_011141 [Penicillium cosmopolitanum]KAJ5388600.1 hypothetical protein N7509_011141 [Penicillium cosmopolitanum]